MIRHLGILLLIVILIARPFPVQASDFVQGCMKAIEFNMLEKNKFGPIKERVEKVCACQEKELLKAGLNAAQLSEFVKGAGSAEPQDGSVAAGVRIAALMNGPDIQKACGSPFF